VQVLAGLSSVDHMIAFDEDVPYNLIRLIEPDVYVKGGDYTREQLPEADLVEEMGGQVVLLPITQDRSTSGIIERIRQVYNGPQEH
jgi:D-beta-D-heptose 7-phosphate kinase / D-beta-D-heptose 1-phosphate adenosyltransferase